MKLLSAAFAFLASQAMAQGLEFRGMPLGMSEAEFRKANPQFDCSGSSQQTAPMGDRHCDVSYESMYRKDMGRRDRGPQVDMAALKYGGAIAELIGAFFYLDRLTRVAIYIKAADFQMVQAALQEKYGTPSKVEQSRYTTRAGAVVTGSTYRWQMPGGNVTAAEYSNNLDNSLVTYETKDAEALFNIRKNATAKGNAGSL